MSYLVGYALVMFGLVFIREWPQASSLNRFLVADRKVGGIVGAMSIAASWIWAPAIFVSTRVGYEWGFSGLVWFILPNMAALIIFAPLANLVRSRLPEGFSYIQFLRNGSQTFRRTQLGLQLLMQVVIYSIQLTAGSELLSAVTGANYNFLVLGMALTPFIYTFFSGLRTSVFTDAVQYVVILFPAYLILFNFPKIDSFHQFDARVFHPFDPSMLVSFGFPSALGLLVAIFADHQQWQRAFAIRENSLVKTYWLGALFHGLVTFALGAIGCLINQVGFKPERVDLVGINFIQANYPAFFVALFVIMAMCALISTLDSGLCAFSSLSLTEVVAKNKISLSRGRSFMLFLAIAGSCISLGRPSLITLWFLAGTIRLASFAPTLSSIAMPALADRYGALAIFLGLIVGTAVFSLGVLEGVSWIRTVGMLSSIGASIFTLLWGILRLKLWLPCNWQTTKTSLGIPTTATSI